jgi:hypothetical protein
MSWGREVWIWSWQWKYVSASILSYQVLCEFSRSDPPRFPPLTMSASLNGSSFLSEGTCKNMTEISNYSRNRRIFTRNYAHLSVWMIRWYWTDLNEDICQRSPDFIVLYVIIEQPFSVRNSNGWTFVLGRVGRKDPCLQVRICACCGQADRNSP